MRDALLRLIFDRPNFTASLKYKDTTKNNPMWQNVGDLRAYLASNGELHIGQPFKKIK
ncbi:hypothetical protein NST07_09920 [Paenibacillus sp. FSL L8-0340]|uniref:hypothetical protein n=1 Tax=Paenibacillus sp. FSL L8-0340 TaxID=2954685 RepID=UPI0031594A9B